MVREAAKQLTEALIVSTRTKLRERVFRDSSTRVVTVVYLKLLFEQKKGSIKQITYQNGTNQKVGKAAKCSRLFSKKSKN